MARKRASKRPFDFEKAVVGQPSSDGSPVILVIFGEEGLRRALSGFIEHFHQERNHQGLDNVIPFPLRDHAADSGEVKCRKRLGGLLKFYHREAA